MGPLGIPIHPKHACYRAVNLDLPVCAGRDPEFPLRSREWLRDERARGTCGRKLAEINKSMARSG